MYLSLFVCVCVQNTLSMLNVQRSEENSGNSILFCHLPGIKFIYVKPLHKNLYMLTYFTQPQMILHTFTLQSA